jgi:hypothetical protein
MEHYNIAELARLIDQLEYCVKNWKGKTTITQTDIDVLNRALVELRK